MNELEISLFHIINDLYEEIKAMRPTDGFSSPRDIELVRKVNKKTAVLERLQEAMQIIVPTFDIRDSYKIVEQPSCRCGKHHREDSQCLICGEFATTS